MFGTTLQGPVVALSGECVICVIVGSCFFAIFRRLALHLQPRAEPTPVETVAPPRHFAQQSAEPGRRFRRKRREGEHLTTLS